MIEPTKQCERCGRRMIRDFENVMLPTNPPQYPWSWWCGCGYTEVGGIERGLSSAELRQHEWEEANAAYRIFSQGNEEEAT